MSRRTGSDLAKWTFSSVFLCDKEACCFGIWISWSSIKKDKMPDEMWKSFHITKFSCIRPDLHFLGKTQLVQFIPFILTRVVQISALPRSLFLPEGKKWELRSQTILKRCWRELIWITLQQMFLSCHWLYKKLTGISLGLDSKALDAEIKSDKSHSFSFNGRPWLLNLWWVDYLHQNTSFPFQLTCVVSITAFKSSVFSSFKNFFFICFDLVWNYIFS